MSQIRYSISAKCYDKRGRLISEGQNSYTKSHPLMQSLAKEVGLDEKIYLHAEVQALLKAGERKVHTMKIMRQTKDGALANAKPCPICTKAIKLFDVQFVQYSIVGSLVRQSVETL